MTTDPHFSPSQLAGTRGFLLRRPFRYNAGMDENPYKAPRERESGAKEQFGGPFIKLLIFAMGAAFLWPASWLIGRGLIPPDDVALRLSVIVYIAAVAVWGIYVASRQPSA